MPAPEAVSPCATQLVPIENVRVRAESPTNSTAATPVTLVTFLLTAQTVSPGDPRKQDRYATARMLRAAGFKTRETARGTEALAQAGCACAIVLDVHLPDIPGLEVCRLLRSNAATVVFRSCTSPAIYVSDDDRASGHSAGADAYLLAPVSQQELSGTFDKLLESRHGWECGALCFPTLP